jgi:hypothetical protein
MNAELAKLIEAAGAPRQVMDKLWFQVFCEKFAYLLTEEFEKACEAES